MFEYVVSVKLSCEELIGEKWTTSSAFRASLGAGIDLSLLYIIGYGSLCYHFH